MSPVRLPLAPKTIRYGAVVVVAVSILLSSVEEPGSSAPLFSHGPFGVIEIDKWVHGIGYALLTATLGYAVVAPVPNGYRRRLVLSVCLAVAFGVCIELLQWPIPYRTASALDAVANAIGSCLSASVWWWAMRTVRFGDSRGISV